MYLEQVLKTTQVLPLQNAPDITAAINMSYSIDMANNASTVINLGWQYHDDYKC